MPETAADGQRLGVEQLTEMAAAAGDIEVLSACAVPERPGWLQMEVSLDCSDTPHAPGGLRLRARERFMVLIPPGFPFALPEVRVPHMRWAGAPHVQFGQCLCLYAAPSIEWASADGMRGLVERLTLWLDRASMGQLDPDDQPLHPPVAYITPAAGVVVVRADLDDLAPPSRSRRSPAGRGRADAGDPPHEHRLVVAVCDQRHAGRLDVVEWIGRGELHRLVDGRLPAGRDGRPLVGALGVLMDTEIGFEYPWRVSDLLRGLESAGVPADELMIALSEVAAINHVIATSSITSAPALHVLVGSPSRRAAGGAVRQHLVCWRADEMGMAVSEGLTGPGSPEQVQAEVAGRMQGVVRSWMGDAGLTWVRVMEARPEVTVRRDIRSAAEWLRGRRILVLGCGALGAPIAEACVRAGAAAVTVVDQDLVSPGILVRQPYADAEIGIAKAAVLADRLNRIRPDQPVTAVVGSVQDTVLADGTPPPFDLVIDATADASVASLVELRRSAARSEWPPLMSVIIGHDARRGVVTVSRSGAIGAGRDVLRRLALAGRGQHAARLHEVASDIFPTKPRGDLFEPEPGCSQPTFTGSAAELGALAGSLLDTGLRAVSGLGGVEEPMAAAVVRLDVGTGSGARLPGVDWFGWRDGDIIEDRASGYEVRLSWAAVSSMRAECRRGARVRGSDVETGGLLIGRIDDACRCVWIDGACGPPPDSRLSAFHLEHGVEGVPELIGHHRDRSAGESTYVGMWHSHPMGGAELSPTDRAAMHELVAASVGGPPRALLLILGGEERRWAAWLEQGVLADVHAELVTRRSLGIRPQALATPAEHDRTWWPGGWTTVRARPAAPPRRGLLAWLRRRLGGRR